MKLGSMKVAIFSQATVALLQTDVNNFLSGLAVTGPPAFTADFAGNKEFVQIFFITTAGVFSAMIVYTE